MEVTEAGRARGMVRHRGPVDGPVFHDDRYRGVPEPERSRGDEVNTLVLVNSIPFGKKLAALIKDSVFLYGASKKDERKEHYDQFEDRDDLIVIASSGIASTGISIDRVFCLVMIDSGRSFIRTIQSVGRSLRKGHDKNSVHVVDVYSRLK